MNKIHEAFKNRKAFIPFITCGDPDVDTTKAAILEMVKNGADLIEIGIPFSDPTAEGVVIQGANIRALKGGITTDKVFDMVADVRKEISIPLVFMTYANVIFSYGAKKFFDKCNEVGIDGIILPDIPFEEKGEFLDVADSHKVDLISLIAPTSDDRIAMIAKEAKGFLYIVSSLGVTGTRSEITTDLDSIVKVVKENTSVPCAIGFGISTPQQANEMSQIADGVIVGSAIINLLKKYKTEAPKYIGKYVKEMKEAMN
ncbi:tryptophan synthase, alpha subunit [Lachnoanaerobaculum saburreum F0468]|uniref:Tryptophan synthase alpha chain n=1 Tax=Lachnoanaerobaculum saburreum F0468 TaxID=1095750 RepID=I0R9A2_9FIRM|nr:tryptophan synthase subunit alpha [Lachnoanaerobaculum saburreum]EIC96260.1 tryptophan synthase, alpha subunit [Lachnoanaerobaculum saburreum F0468]